MTKRDDTSMAEQNAEIRRWAEENGLTVGARLGQQPDAVERVAPRALDLEPVAHAQRGRGASSIGWSVVRVDEAVARPRVTEDVWGYWCAEWQARPS